MKIEIIERPDNNRVLIDHGDKFEVIPSVSDEFLNKIKTVIKEMVVAHTLKLKIND